jgi:hypothetical protein
MDGRLNQPSGAKRRFCFDQDSDNFIRPHAFNYRPAETQPIRQSGIETRAELLGAPTPISLRLRLCRALAAKLAAGSEQADSTHLLHGAQYRASYRFLDSIAPPLARRRPEVFGWKGKAVSARLVGMRMDTKLQKH